ncbi:MAG: hypothetical protein VKK04_03945 [Synechococcales bacterium]|nr:hypothetical protein [Synechococcales bacterium]
MPAALRPLSLGTLLSAGVTLYRSHLKAYFGLSVKAHAWFLGMVVLALFWLGVMGSFIPLIPEPVLRFLAWLGVGGIALLIVLYGLAKLFTLGAVIARHGFAELMSQPQSVKTLQTSLKTRLWGFLAIQSLVLIIMLVVSLLLNIGFALVNMFLSQLVLVFVGGPDSSWLLVLLQLLVNLVIYALYFSVWARFFIPELSYATEPETTILQTIDRSWSLTQRATLRVLIVISVLTLMTLPFYVLALTPSFMIWVTFLSRMIASFNEPGVAERLVLAAGGAVLLGGVMVGLSGVITMPFWQSLKAVVYYDLRIRREGMGLQLRDRPS